VIQNIDLTSMIGFTSGDSLTLTVLAADCGLGGHGGYAYVDGFSDVRPPDPNVPLPPTVWLLGSGLLGLTGWRRFKKS
jgi:PEP-CTERM motif